MEVQKILIRKKQITEILNNDDLLKQILSIHRNMWKLKGKGQLMIFLEHLPTTIKYSYLKLKECIKLAKKTEADLSESFYYSVNRIRESVGKDFIPFEIVDYDGRSYLFEISREGQLINLDVAKVKIGD